MRPSLPAALGTLFWTAHVGWSSPATAEEPVGPTDHRPTVEDPLRLIVHNPTGRVAPSEDCDVDLCASLLELIIRAEKSIDFAVYGMRGQPAILKALFDAKARGVRVRGVVDRTIDGQNYYTDTERLVEGLGTVRDDLRVDQLKAPTVQPYDPTTSKCYLPAPDGFTGPKQCLGYDLGDRCIVSVHASREPLGFEGDIMHNKYFVVDGQYVWMGSTNVSDSGTGGYNANLVGVVNHREVASWYTREFEQMWAQDRFHDAKVASTGARAEIAPGLVVEGWFSPQDKPMTYGVQPLIKAAEKRIDVGIFFLTHKGVTKDLIEAHRRGVKVRIIMDATAAKNGYAKHELVRASGIPVKIENWGGKMHMKAAAIDGRTVITGSMNWTSAGEGGNDENTLIIHSARHAEQFHRAFDAMWADIPDRWLEGRPDPESRDSRTACTDGSDNDFDKQRDGDDPGCSDEPPPLPELPPFTVVPKGEGHLLVKGNISSSGRKTYHVPGQKFYEQVKIDPTKGEAYFCSEQDARAAGFWRSTK